MRILIVDDSITIRKIVKKMLQDLGFEEFSEASDGLQALQMVSVEKFELILMDWKMPVLSGLETLRQLKANPEYASIPVVMVTSESQKPKILEAIQSGAANYIVKPFDLAILKEKLEPFVKRNAA